MKFEFNLEWRVKMNPFSFLTFYHRNQFIDNVKNLFGIDATAPYEEICLWIDQLFIRQKFLKRS